MSSSWKMHRLGDYLLELPKSTLPASYATKDGVYPFYCSSPELKLAPTWLQERPTILMGTGGTASVHQSKDRFSYSTDTWAFRTKESSELTQSFAYRVLEKSLPRIEYAGFEGSGLRHLRKSFIKDLCFLAPAPDRQDKATLILDAIDKNIEITQLLICKYQKIKAGLVNDLFARGVLPNGRLRPSRNEMPELYRETTIGWMPKEWHFETLGSILLKSGGYLQTGPFGSQLHAHEYQSEGIPVVMPQNINDGLIEVESIARISELRASSLSRHALKVGDIIIARRGDLSRSAPIRLEESGWICGTGCFLFRLGKTELNHFFFSHIYRHNIIQRQVTAMQVGTTMPSLNNSVMSKLLFPLPEPAEQNEISKRIEAVETKIHTLIRYKEKCQYQKQGLMVDLLSASLEVKDRQSENTKS